MTHTTATTKWFNETKQFGFLILPDGQEVFVHANNIQSDEKSLLPGQHVTCTIHPGSRGSQARDVVPIEANGNV